MSDAAPAPAIQKLESFKRSMSLQVGVKTTSEVSEPEPEPVVDVAATPTLGEVDAAFEKELEAMNKEGAE